MYYKGRSFRVHSKWCFISVYDSDASVVCHGIVNTKILAILPLSVLVLLQLLVSFITIMFLVYLCFIVFSSLHLSTDVLCIEWDVKPVHYYYYYRVLCIYLLSFTAARVSNKLTYLLHVIEVQFI